MENGRLIAWRHENDEIRMTNDERMTKLEDQKTRVDHDGFGTKAMYRLFARKPAENVSTISKSGRRASAKRSLISQRSGEASENNEIRMMNDKERKYFRHSFVIRH
jgi:hypothetical protein